jgi:hypothetical protein
VRFRPGRRLKGWDKNVIAVGLSSGFLEPLESTSIHLIQTAIHRILAMFPSTGFHTADIDEFNLQSRTEYEDVRDFIIAHYKVTRRAGEPFWDHVRAMNVPDSLRDRLELFCSSGRFFKHNAQELFGEESWVQVGSRCAQIRSPSSWLTMSSVSSSPTLPQPMRKSRIAFPITVNSCAVFPKRARRNYSHRSLA